MLVQHCALEEHRLIVPVSLTKPLFQGDTFLAGTQRNHYRALIDTGAQRTVVTRSVINANALMRLGHMQFAGIHGPKTHTRYLASIGLWATRNDTSTSHLDMNRSELSLFAIDDPFEVVDMDDNHNYDLILGFDILKRFDFRFESRTRSFELIIVG